MSLNNITVAVHQPNYIPWIGYFHKMFKSDIFVFLDHVQYTKRSFINRNRVKGPRGAIWLTVPVKVRQGDRIMDVRIDNTQEWAKKHEQTLRAFYGKAPYFREIHGFLEEIYSYEWEYLVDLNITLIKTIGKILDIKTRFILSHELNLKESKMDMIIEICKKVGANIYFSGLGAQKYQDPSAFERNGIRLIYQKFEHPIYPQRFEGFIPNLSILDILYNVGIKKSREILKDL